MSFTASLALMTIFDVIQTTECQQYKFSSVTNLKSTFVTKYIESQTQKRLVRSIRFVWEKYSDHVVVVALPASRLFEYHHHGASQQFLFHASTPPIWHSSVCCILFATIHATISSNLTACAYRHSTIIVIVLRAVFLRVWLFLVYMFLWWTSSFVYLSVVKKSLLKIIVRKNYGCKNFFKIGFS